MSQKAGYTRKNPGGSREIGSKGGPGFLEQPPPRGFGEYKIGAPFKRGGPFNWGGEKMWCALYYPQKPLGGRKFHHSVGGEQQTTIVPRGPSSLWGGTPGGVPPLYNAAGIIVYETWCAVKTSSLLCSTGRPPLLGR